MRKTIIFIVVLSLTITLLTASPTPARAHWGFFWPGFAAGIGTAAILSPFSIPQAIITHLRMGTMVAIIDLGMGIMATTMVDIGVKKIMGVDIRVKTLTVDIRVKKIMAVDIRDSWV